MVAEIVPVIEWISSCMEIEKKNKHSPISLWSELYELGKADHQAERGLPKLPEGAAPMVIYVTGTLDEIRQVNGPFYRMNEPDDLVYMIYGQKNQSDNRPFTREISDMLLRYVTICYVPLNKVKFYQAEIDRFIIFTKGKPEIWMRGLLKKNKVSGLVGWEHPVDASWHVSWSSSYDDFSYALFLKDDFVPTAPSKETGSVFPNTPAGLKLGLLRSLKESDTEKKELLWKQAMDQSAMQMLDEYWLLNGMNVKEFLPHLVKKVQEYCLQIRSIPPRETNIKRIENSFESWLKKESL